MRKFVAVALVVGIGLMVIFLRYPGRFMLGELMGVVGLIVSIVFFNLVKRMLERGDPSHASWTFTQTWIAWVLGDFFFLIVMPPPVDSNYAFWIAAVGTIVAIAAFCATVSCVEIIMAQQHIYD